VKNAYDALGDEELVAHCNSGDRESATAAFETLYRRHRKFVLRVATRYGADRDLAAEVLQDTFLHFLQRFPPTGSGVALTARLTTYLYPIARNLTVDAMRRSGRLTASALAPDEIAVSEPDAERDVASLLRRLPADRRELLVLRFVDGMSLAEIATALEIPLGTAKSRVHTAIQELRKRLRISQLDNE
jgi:RNA polymerase sigma-70 factor (ECF subfamily)